MTTVYVATALVVFILGLFAVITDRQAKLDHWRAEAERIARERDAVEVERDIATDLLEKYKADARVVIPIRRQSSIPDVSKSGGMVDRFPAQRDGHEPWPPVARAVEAETTPVFDDLCFDRWEMWGEEADRDA